MRASGACENRKPPSIVRTDQFRLGGQCRKNIRRDRQYVLVSGLIRNGRFGPSGRTEGSNAIAQPALKRVQPEQPALAGASWSAITRIDRSWLLRRRRTDFPRVQLGRTRQRGFRLMSPGTGAALRPRMNGALPATEIYGIIAIEPWNRGPDTPANGTKPGRASPRPLPTPAG